MKKGNTMNFSIQLTLDEVNLVLAALGKLPLETSIATFDKIKTQAQKQAQEQAPQNPEQAPE